MKTHIKLLYLVIILLALLLGWIVMRENYAARILNKINTPPAKKNAYWLNRDELFECFPTDTNSIIFLGTSLTQQFELAELFHNSTIKNRGIVGDVTESALLRLGPVVRCRPKKIFIELGINDL
ncbi:MAG: GDSL-type esterase/lipase family protein, partial [Bacteroidia bacterium]